MTAPLLTNESFEQEENRHILTHWHTSLELIRILEGTMQCMVNGQIIVIQKGDICLISPNQLHRIAANENHTCRFQRLLIDPKLLTTDTGVYNDYIRPVLYDEGFSRAVAESGTSFASRIGMLMDRISDMEKIKPVAFELGIIALLHMILQELYGLYQQSKEEKPSLMNLDALLQRQMADYIYQNYAKKIRLGDIASAGNISHSKCCKVFKEYAGQSPIDFLNLYRLEVSADRLRNTDEKIVSIAMACGFGQQSYFNRLFLREYGMTPKQYRLKHRS